MSKVIKVVGVDPSMSNFGLAIGTLDLDTDKLEIHGLELVETKAGGTKKTVRVNSDDLRRLKKSGAPPGPSLNRPTWYFVNYQWVVKALARRLLTAYVSAFLLALISHLSRLRQMKLSTTSGIN